MNNLDMNIENYTLSELLAIIGLDDPDPENIIDNTNYYIEKYKNKNPEMAVFFKSIQSQLLQYVEGLETDSDNDDENNKNKIMVEGFGTMNNEAIYPSGEKQISDWYTNEVLQQSDQNQLDKITDRKEKIQIFGNDKLPMKREQIATTDTFNLPVKQDSLNPNLKNTINRFINLDSQFRQYTSGSESQSTNYTCDLSDTIKNTLKLSLYSYQIPFSWYTIDKAYGNTCFWISDPSSGIIVPISVPSGNYSHIAFITQLNLSFTASGFTFPVTPVYYNSNSGIITLYLADGIYSSSDGSSSFTISADTQIIFFDFTSNLQCNINCYSKSNHYFNNTLGWIMGYRLPYVNVDISGNTAASILDLNGTKYLILAIDDYNQNHVNNTLISISQFSNTLKMPTYYSPDLPYTCITPAQQGNNLNTIISEIGADSQTQNGLLIASKYQEDYTSTQIVLPSAPRTLTNAQLYTINSINNNNNNLTNYLAKAPTTSDILAIIPVKTSVGVPTGTLLVEFSGSLQDSERTYFGPVNIERMAVKLLDDKGNILNLNGNDWCVSLIAECLYQY
jgi:hypothetical protein